MKLGETTASARRIGPLKAVDAGGNPVVAFPTTGAVTVKVNDGAFVAAGGTIHVIGDGYVYYQATPADASVRGFIVVRLAEDCEEFTFREEVEVAPQGIPVGTEDSTLLAVGPLEAKDADGLPVLGSAGIDVEVSINGAAWGAPAGTLVEATDGYYDYRAAPSEVASRGWIAVRLSGSCQELVLRATIVEETLTPSGLPITVGGDSGGDSDDTAGRVSGDLALTWSNASGDADLSLFELDLAGESLDLTVDRGLATAVILSLFTDRRAEADDIPPSGDPTDRRGWWADQFAAVSGDRMGSRLWLLDRSKNTSEVRRRAEEYVREALAWMIEDRVVASIDVTIESAATGLVIGVGLKRPGRDPIAYRFAHTWDSLQEAS